MKHDKLFCSGLLKDGLEVEVTDGDIKKIFRLGKRDAVLQLLDLS